jgi:hypothetical protein
MKQVSHIVFVMKTRIPLLAYFLCQLYDSAHTEIRKVLTVLLFFPGVPKIEIKCLNTNF